MDVKEEIEELKKRIENEGLDKVAEHIGINIDKWKQEPVRFAVTGASGVGKSTFINTIRNCKRGEHGYAETGSSGDTTDRPIKYKFPSNSKIDIYDLPGYGTKACPKEEYVERMDLYLYNYVLVFVTIITTDDIEIGKILQELEKPFSFVRSKLDTSLRDAKDEGKSIDQERLEIKSKSLKILQEVGFTDVDWFLISCRDTRIGQFDDLHAHIENSLAGLKSESFIYSALGKMSYRLIDKKYQLLKQKVLTHSLVAGVVAAVPIPGIDIAVNVGYLVSKISEFKHVFGFDQKFVRDTANLKTIKDKLYKNSLLILANNYDAMAAFVILELGTFGTLMAFQSATDALIPFIGSLFSGGVCGVVIYKFLHRLLETCRSDAAVVYSHLMAQPDRINLDSAVNTTSAQVAVGGADRD